MRLFLALAAAVALGATLLLLACNPEAYQAKQPGSAATNQPAAATGAPSAPVPAAPTPSPADDVRRITVAELKQELDANRAVVIDVRNEASYKAGHIRGARLIPSTEIDQHASELPKDKLIVFYCS